MNASKEKSIRNIGIYFLVLGIICACLAPMYISDYGMVVPICVILMSVPRLIYNNKKWASVLLMISAILMTLALMYYDGMLILLSYVLNQMDLLDLLDGVIIMGVITVIALLSGYLCFKLYKLLFKKEQS